MKVNRRFDAFPAYTPIEPFEVLSARLGIPVDRIVKLDANENPYGPSPRARRALAQLEYPHIYPDPESRALRQALAQFTGVPMELLLPGAGADELIDLLLRVVIEPGDTVFSFPPTFGMYAFDARLSDARVVEIPRRADFSLDLDAVRSAARLTPPKVVFLTAPNNPDGSLPAPEEVQALSDLGALLVVDEAYIEFAGEGLGRKVTRIEEVARRENLAVLRTFSKWAGLAGLRVGYGAFPAWLMPALWVAKQPYNVSTAASAAALASMDDLELLAAQVDLIKKERDRLTAELARIPFLNPFPSQANFVLCRVVGREARGLKEALARRGVLVRYYDTPLLKDAIRVTAGRPSDTDSLLDALRQV